MKIYIIPYELNDPLFIQVGLKYEPIDIPKYVKDNDRELLESWHQYTLQDNFNLEFSEKLENIIFKILNSYRLDEYYIIK